MAEWRKYRNRQIVEAHELDKDTGYFNPQSGVRQQGYKGDFIVRNGKRSVVVSREHFHREYEPIEDK